MPEETEVTLTAAGDVEFGPIAYALSDAGKTYTYTITEDGFDINGWEGSPTSITAKVTVTDEGDGTLSTDIEYTPEEATFTNTYTAEPTEATIEAKKVLEGGSVADYTFTFQLSDQINKLLHPVELPATGGNGLAVPIAVAVIVATGEAARRMRRRRNKE